MQPLLSPGAAFAVLTCLSVSVSAAEPASSPAPQPTEHAAAADVAGTHETAPSAATGSDAPLLKFSQFFAPIGDRGLEYSAELRALAGQRVRLLGHMVREENPTPGRFLLAAYPSAIEAGGRCYFDDTPPATVHVIVSNDSSRPVPYRLGRMELVGTIELGPRLEADGRNSVVRLVLDPAAVAPLCDEAFTGTTGGVTLPPSSATHHIHD